MLDDMYVTKSVSTGLYPNLDLWTVNKLQLQLQLQLIRYDTYQNIYLFIYVFIYLFTSI